MKNPQNRARGGVFRRFGTRRSDLRSLLRSRGVQALLVATATAQAVSTARGGVDVDERPLARRLAAPVESVAALQLTPVVVRAPEKLDRGDPDVAAAEARRLAEAYRRTGYDVSEKLAGEIYRAAVENDIDPRVAFGLVRTESEFKDYATSHVGAIGLTQLMPGTARWFKRGITERELRDSRTNLSIGFRYLRELIDRYEGDTELALLAYNRGTGTVDRILKRGGDPDNGYAGKVMRGAH